MVCQKRQLDPRFCALRRYHRIILIKAPIETERDSLRFQRFASIFSSSSTHCAADSFANGTRKGEQET